ncbi:MAG: RhuM family protein [Opitutales bacterium]
METKSDIVIYKEEDGKISINARFQQETIWLKQNQIAELFATTKQNISQHLRNIFVEKELTENLVVKDFLTPASDGKNYHTKFYNLDAIIAVGYRVNSKKATQFRQWATDVLKQYLKQGYVLNQQALKQQKKNFLALKTAIQLIERQTNLSLEDKQKLYDFLKDFANDLDLLDDYDHKQLNDKGITIKNAVVIEPEEFLSVVKSMRSRFSSDLFGAPKDESFNSSVRQIYQTAFGEECYPSIEEKAAMLLYLIVKNHSFVDGNKRIAAACFLYFLQKNGILYKNNLPVLNDGTLFALTLLVAESKMDEKETMKRIIVSVLNKI